MDARRDRAVVGPEPTVSRFLERTRHTGRIEGVVRRAPSKDLNELTELVGPAVENVLLARRQVALAAVERAVGAGTAASGIDQVWRQARRERNALVVVEESYRQPARVRDDASLDPVRNPTPADVIDDVVDDTIELVLAAGGRVEIVPDRALAAHQRIVLAPTRTRRR